MHNINLDILADDNMNQLLSEQTGTPELISRSKQIDESSLSVSRGRKLGKKKTGNSNSKDFKLNFSGESLLNSVILAEVLGKPKCLRWGRR